MPAYSVNGPVQSCIATGRLYASAIAHTFLHSVMPPAHVGSIITMSAACFSSSGRYS